MANQGNQEQQGKHTPTGTSGRQGGSDPQRNEPPRGDQGSTGGGRRIRRDDEEESGLGNRITNR